MVTDETASDSRWIEHCISFWAEDDCVRPTNANGYARCQWIPAPDDYDCSLMWPTPEPEEGCCAGSDAYTAVSCNAESVRAECTAMASCHWLPGSNVDCEWDEESTTASPPHTGCCTLHESQHENSGWAARCPEFWNEDECVEAKDGFAQQRCGWTDTDEYFDCSELGPTTTTAAPGCCAGDNVYTTTMCNQLDDKDSCNDRAACHWMANAEQDDCAWPTTTGTTLEPGCCYIADAALLGTRWEAVCETMYDEDYCVGPVDSSGDNRCQWTAMPDNPEFDCTLLWPTPTPQHGCCAGDSAQSTARCAAAARQDICDSMSSCHWNSGEYADCEWDETTTDTPSLDAVCWLTIGRLRTRMDGTTNAKDRKSVV